MAATERLKDFPVKATPTGSDILFVGDASNGYIEVQSTIGSIFTGYSPALTSIAGLTTVADQFLYTTAPDTYATGSITAFGRNLVSQADAAGTQTLLGLTIGADVQAHSNALDSIAGLTTAADQMIYLSGSNIYNTTGITAFGRTLVNSADAPTALGALGALPLAGGTMTGAINMGAHQINNVADPVLLTDVASKGYVDSVAQGITFQAACRVATTAALTATYANGTAGVGATLTNSGAQAALAIDGVTLSLNDRILVKNQASTFQNGIYVATNLGSGATNWVLTRATDYDQPSEVTPGDLVLVTQGTTNSNASWIETATVTTIGTDPITFSIFSTALPVGLPYGGTGASLTASNGGIFYSNATTGAILAGTATAGQMLRSGASSAPSWSTATYPGTTTINQLLFSSAANTVTGLATANTATLVTNSSGVPSFSAGLAVKSINVQILTASAGTYTPTAGMVFCIVEAQAAGGGGGGAITTGGGQNSIASAGGAGAYSKGWFSAATIGASKPYTIGLQGVGGGVGGTNGTAGGNLAFSSLIGLNGGSGGTGSSSATAGFRTPGGAGGAVTTAGNILSIPGAPGNIGYGGGGAGVNARGGETPLGFSGGTVGGPGAAGFAGPPSNTAQGYGAGGNGGISLNGGGGATGMDGLPGVIIIYEFIGS